MAAQAAYFQEKRGAVFNAADYGLDEVEVWPENWKAWDLFYYRLSTQWRTGVQVFMGGAVSVPTGLDYPAAYPLLDRIAEDQQEWMEIFEDLQVLESAALQQIRDNNKD